MLVAALLIFAVATTGDSATCCWSGLNESILALVCLSLGALLLCIFTCLHCILCALLLFCIIFWTGWISVWLMGVSRGKRPNTQVMSDTIGTRTRVAVTDRRRMPD